MTKTDQFQRQQIGRAKNAILRFFERRLSVPKIYIDAEWSGNHVDVLAIDRDGVGDVHTALLFAREYFDHGLLNIVEEGNDLKDNLERSWGIPAQFKYICVADILPDGRFRHQDIDVERFNQQNLAEDGLGRIGLIHISIPGTDDPIIKVLITPERFRAHIAKLADEYVLQHQPDAETRA